DREHVQADKVLKGKAGFLSPTTYTIASIIVIGLWWFIGNKMRQLSIESDREGHMDYEKGKSWIGKNMFWASFFIVLFGLTVASTVPWLWLMSINAHWFSTMYSWYTFASTFVAGVSLISLFVIYLKNKGYLQYVNKEHLHDLGKFQFAFSVFWTYLWFSQFMLIWYANIPEETTYFKPLFEGAYTGVFYLNLVINFLAPLLIYMSSTAKRNYTTVTFMSVAL